MRWAIRVHDRSWDLDELPVITAQRVCETAGVRLVDLDPIGWPGHLGCLIAGFASASSDVSFDDALRAAVALPLGEALAALEFKDEGGSDGAH